MRRKVCSSQYSVVAGFFLVFPRWTVPRFCPAYFTPASSEIFGLHKSVDFYTVYTNQNCFYIALILHFKIFPRVLYFIPMSIVFRKDFIFLEVFFILSGLVVVRGEDSTINDHITHLKCMHRCFPQAQLLCSIISV